MGYSFITGIWKSIKNTIIVLTPAIIAAWVAFIASVPDEYKTVVMAIGGFIGYLAKNWFQNKDL